MKTLRPTALAILDLSLPDQSREIHPKVKVLFTSGYTDDVIVRRGLLQRGGAFLEKPFTPSLLARRVREVLDS